MPDVIMGYAKFARYPIIADTALMKSLGITQNTWTIKNISLFHQVLGFRGIFSVIFIGVVSFEAAAEIYNEKTHYLTQLNPERLEEAFFLYKILPFVTKFETWPRDTHGRVCIEH